MREIAEIRAGSKALDAIYLNRLPPVPDRERHRILWLAGRFAFPSPEVAELVADLAFGGGAS